MSSLRLLCSTVLAASLFTLAMPAFAASAVAVGNVTKQPIPRFVSLRASVTNVREGPSVNHRISWVFHRAGQPLEVVAEFDIWRRVRDSDGTEGWLMSRTISSRRTAVVSPWSKDDDALPLYDADSASSRVVAKLQPKVLATIEECNGTWCRLSGEGFSGWMEQEKLWGAYPGEKVK
jgi:SH3-like domain-containing protein